MAQVKKVRGRDTRPNYPELGRLYLGSPKQQYAPGKELPYFRVEFNTDRGLDLERLKGAWAALYGQIAANLPGVYFFGNHPDDVLSSANESWAVSGNGNPLCVIRCDGETILRQQTDRGLSFDPAPCRFPLCTGKRTKAGDPVPCQLNARLQFWLPEFMQETATIGYFMLNMHGSTSFESVLGSLITMSNTPVGIAGQPFRLYRQEETVIDPDGRPGKHWIVKLENISQVGNLLPAGQVETTPQLAAGNGNSDKPWYTDGTQIQRVADELGIPVGKAARDMQRNLDSFPNGDELVIAWKAWKASKAS